MSGEDSKEKIKNKVYLISWTQSTLTKDESRQNTFGRVASNDNHTAYSSGPLLAYLYEIRQLCSNYNICNILETHISCWLRRSARNQIKHTIGKHWAQKRLFTTNLSLARHWRILIDMITKNTRYRDWNGTSDDAVIQDRLLIFSEIFIQILPDVTRWLDSVWQHERVVSQSQAMYSSSAHCSVIWIRHG